MATASAALETDGSIGQTVTVSRVAGLMKGGSNGETALALDRLTFIEEGDFLAEPDVKNGMAGDP